MKQTLSILLIAGLATLAVLRPWQQVKEQLGVVTAMDSLLATPATVGPVDTLMVQSIAITLPDIVTDSLSYTVRSQEKKKVYLEEQSAWLNQYNARLDLKLKARKAAMQQKENSLRKGEQDAQDAQVIAELNSLLSKQNPDSRGDSRSLGVSDMASEIEGRDNASKFGPSSRGPSSPGPSSRGPK